MAIMDATLYQIKLYDRTNSTLKATLSPSVVISDISFSGNINGGLGEVRLEINENINTTLYTYGDVIRITMFNDNNKSGKTIYMGYITKIGRKQTQTRQLIELTLLGIASLLTEQVISLNANGMTAGQAIKYMIDTYNSNYGEVFDYIMGDTIIDGPLLGTVTYSGTYLNNMKNIAEFSGYNLFIDGGGIVRFKPISSTPIHYLTNQKDVESIDINEDLEGVVNSATFVDEANNVATYQDTVSINAYGKKHYNGTTKTHGLAYLQNYVMNYVLERKDPKREAVIVVNRKYNLESIKPGDTVKINNRDFAGIDNIKIVKLSYSPDRCILYLDKYVSFGQEVIQN